MTNLAKLVSFDVTSEKFDAIKIGEKLKEISQGLVWNFVPGTFVVKSDIEWKKISSDIISIPDLPSFIVIAFDPALVTGNLPPAAWDSWFLDIFSDQVDRTAQLNDWTPSYLSKVKEYQKNKRQMPS
jgi:hypothetical protein